VFKILLTELYAHAHSCGHKNCTKSVAYTYIVSKKRTKPVNSSYQTVNPPYLFLKFGFFFTLIARQTLSDKSLLT